MIPSKYSTRAASIKAECTRDAIFLFQRMVWIYHDLPDGYVADGDGGVIWDDENDYPQFGPDSLTPLELSDIEGASGFGMCTTESWNTELVFLTREEAEEHGLARSYNYPDGWRVYAVCAQGELAEGLK